MCVWCVCRGSGVRAVSLEDTLEEERCAFKDEKNRCSHAHLFITSHTHTLTCMMIMAISLALYHCYFTFHFLLPLSPCISLSLLYRSPFSASAFIQFAIAFRDSFSRNLDLSIRHLIVQIYSVQVRITIATKCTKGFWPFF